MIGCIIQARMGSSRLPKKVMKKIDNDNTVLDYVIKQVNYSKKIIKIIVATTNLSEDDLICDHLSSKKIKFFRGSSDDVLDRYFQCAKKFSIDIIVRITADNPLIDPKIIDMVIEKFEKNTCDYATNTLPRTFPYGTEVEVFSFDSLQKAWKDAKMPSEREHVTPHIRNLQNKFKIINVENKNDFSHLRYTVDRDEDLKLVQEIINNVSEIPILMKNIIKLFDEKPEIFEINKKILHDGYLSSLKKDKEFTENIKNNQID